MVEPPPSSMIGRRVGRFRIVTSLGAGGIASVWKATDELLQRPVALKILHESFAASSKARRRFVHEAQAISRLDHPGIVTVYDTGDSDGVTYIALTYVEGETVSHRAGKRLMPIEEALRIVTAAAEALEHAHTRGMIHRDVTGRNIMVRKDDRVFVLDFGLVLAAGMSRLTTSETGLGTMAYMSPEAIRGGEIDARTDIYGLGVVLFEALTGAFPFPGDRPESTAFAKLHHRPRPPSDFRSEVPAALDDLVLAALATDPNLRPPDARAMITALRAAGGALAGGPPPRRPISVRPLATAPTEAAVPQPSEGDREPRRRDLPEDRPLYLAILPFEIEPAREVPATVQAIARRLPEALTAALGREWRVHIVPAENGAGVADSNDPRERARQWGANTLLTGSVTHAGERVRVAFSVRDPWRGVQIGGDLIDGSGLQSLDLEDAFIAAARRALGLRETPPATREVRPSDPAASDRYQLALGFLRRYDSDASVDGAIAALEQLSLSESDDPRILAALARAYLSKHELTRERRWEIEAARACERARTLDPGAPEVDLALGNLWLLGGRLDEALAAFERVAAARPVDLDAWIGKGRVAQGAGRGDEAEKCYRRAIELEPSDWRAYNRLGVLLAERGRLEEALDRWREASRWAPDNALLDFNMGSALYHLDRFDEAIEAYRKSLARHPRASVYSSLGTVLFYLGRHQEAAETLERAVAFSPLSPTLWGNLGNAYHHTPGQQAKAREPLERAIALMHDHLERHPREAKSWSSLAGWLTNLDRDQEALEAIRRALEIDPDNVDVMIRAGHVYLKLADRASSLHWLGNAVRRGYGVGELERDPDLASLRNDPEFQSVLKEGRRARPGGVADSQPGGRP